MSARQGLCVLVFFCGKWELYLECEKQVRHANE